MVQRHKSLTIYIIACKFCSIDPHVQYCLFIPLFTSVFLFKHSTNILVITVNHQGRTSLRMAYFSILKIRTLLYHFCVLSVVSRRLSVIVVFTAY